MTNQMKPIFFISLLLLLIVSASHAQSKGDRASDTLATARLFMKVCNAYKQLPVRMEAEIRNSTNFIAGAEDTAHYRATFCIRKEGSYIAYGGMEQIADDSVVLLVSNRLKRMIMYAHHQSLTDRMTQYLGWQLQDSSVIRLAAKYSVVLLPADKDTACIVVASRHYLAHTELPDETLRAKYSASGLRPYELVQEKRRLVPVSVAVYRDLATQQANADRLLAIGDSSFFVIKEQKTVYRYLDISHREDDRLPVRVSDRVVADVPGKYRPVTAYAGFILTRQ
jgi:hypothetical protein